MTALRKLTIRKSHVSPLYQKSRDSGEWLYEISMSYLKCPPCKDCKNYSHNFWQLHSAEKEKHASKQKVDSAEKEKTDPKQEVDGPEKAKNGEDTALTKEDIFYLNYYTGTSSNDMWGALYEEGEQIEEFLMLNWHIFTYKCIFYK